MTWAEFIKKAAESGVKPEMEISEITISSDDIRDVVFIIGGTDDMRMSNKSVLVIDNMT